VLERSLEITEVLRGEEGDDEDRKLVCTYFGKRFRKIYLVCLLMNLSWRQIKRWDMTCHGLSHVLLIDV